MITDDLIERAMRKAGVSGAQASLGQSESTEVAFESDKLKRAGSSQKTEINLKVIRGGKLGSSSTTDIHDLHGVVQRAWEAAQFGSPVHFEFPGPGEGLPVKLCDRNVPPVTLVEMVGMGGEMLERLKTYNPEILVDCGISKRLHKFAFSNSRGNTFEGESTNFGLGIGGQIVRGTDMLFAGHSVGGRQRKIDPGAAAGHAIAWFRLAEKNASIQSGNMPVIFTPAGLMVLFLSLRLGLDGKSVLLGESPVREKLETAIADPSFTLLDDPLIDFAQGSRRFDDEGVSCRTLPLIEGGVLRRFLYDLDSAGRAETQPTGHGAWRSPSNWVVQPGNTPNQEMIRGVREGLLVHSVMGLGQGNPISGEFSVNVSLGFKIENGEIVGRVKDVMLAGNVYEALKDIVAIGDTPEWVSGDWAWIPTCAPPIMIGKLSVVAK